MPVEPGKIILVAFPFTDYTSGKERPALVVSGSEFNRGDDLVAVPLSSRVNEDEAYGFPILSSETYFAATGLRASSTVKWTKPMTISSKVIVKQLGTIPQDVLTRIQTLIKSIFA